MSNSYISANLKESPDFWNKAAAAASPDIGLSCRSNLQNDSVNPFSFRELACKYYDDEVILFNSPDTQLPKRFVDEESLENLKDNRVKGKISKSSHKRAKEILKSWQGALRERNKFIKRRGGNNYLKFAFITLTLSSDQCHDDYQIKRELLDPFLQTLSRIFHVTHYFWRAEAQKNCNIHFHIITDKFIPHRQLRELWNKQQNKLDYVKNSTNYAKNKNPNSTDIHALRNDNQSIEYLLKYALKEEGNRLIQGRLIGYSDKLNDIKKKYYDLSTVEINELAMCEKSNNIRKFYDENCVILRPVKGHWNEIKKLCPTLSNRLQVEAIELNQYLYDSEPITIDKLTVEKIE